MLNTNFNSHRFYKNSKRLLIINILIRNCSKTGRFKKLEIGLNII